MKRTLQRVFSLLLCAAIMVVPAFAAGESGEVTGTPTPEGMEVRFTLEFWMDTSRRVQKLCIADASLEEMEPPAQRQPAGPRCQ